MQKQKRWDTIWWVLLFSSMCVLCGSGGSCPSPCICLPHSISCSNLSSTALSSLDFHNVTSLTLTSCEFSGGCVRLTDFHALPSLRKLSITQSNLTQFLCSDHDKTKAFASLQQLDLSGNRLEMLDKSVTSLGSVTSLNVSHNQLRQFKLKTFQIKRLKSLDISHNLLTDPQPLKTIQSTIKYLDISDNPWPCSSSLEWMWSWSRPLTDSKALRNSNSTLCLMSGGPRSSTSSLFLVMKEYYSTVLPACHPGCSCSITMHVQNDVYGLEMNVAVNCSGIGLTVFPKLPNNTKSLDLSNNSLTSASYEDLDVIQYNYTNIRYLNMSHNQIDSFSNKFLKISIRSEFTLTHNQLTNIPYDFSKHLQKTPELKLLLGNNPWICVCNAEINNELLKDKIQDLEDIFCGVGSVPESINQKQLMSIKPMVLCPPEDNGSLREAGLQVLCVVFSLCIVLVVAKLVYDFWIYRNRGKLPWIVLKMP